MKVLFKRHCNFIMLSNKNIDIVKIVCVLVLCVKKLLPYLYMDGYEELSSVIIWD